MKYLKLTMVFAAVMLMSACNQSSESKNENTIKPLADASQPSAANADATLPAGHPEVAINPHGATSAVNSNSGVVKEVIDAAGYTYASVENNGQMTWLAGPKTALKVGQTVSWGKAMLMSNFKSKTLDRTFETVYFVSSFQSSEAAAVPASEGTVTETFTSGGYVYLKVDANGSELWIAAPETPIDNGVKVSWNGGAVMKNFKSNSLNRIFEEITFVDQVTIES